MLIPLLMPCAACDFDLGGGSGSEDDCHGVSGGTSSRTELAIAGEVEMDGRRATFASTTRRADAESFHIVIGDRTIRVFDDSVCKTCERDGDGGADAGDAGEGDAGDAGATWTPPRAGDTRLVAVIHIDPTALGTHDLAQLEDAYAEVCDSGVLLDDPEGFFRADGTTLRSADRLALEGALSVNSLAPASSYTLDARLGARGGLEPTFEETVKQSS